MLRIETQTRLAPEEVLKLAKKFFGGYRIKIVEQSPDCESFEGIRDGVGISIKKADKITIVELVSQQWETQVNNFIETLPKRIPVKNF
jgi:hypothetical protein